MAFIDETVNQATDQQNSAASPESWLDNASQETDDVEVDTFDIVASPNDWNFLTIASFIEAGALKIPSYQRNYVWDKKRASKLIESLILGLPVPQVFLYEEGRNDFIVIDGQQRLLSLYFFYKGRFPRPTIRGELRPALRKGVIDDELLNDEKYFDQFKLVLPKLPNGRPNRLHGLSYRGLKEEKTGLDLRTIRNIVVKQVSPQGNAAVFEIFSRLNAGGVNLTPQEIRASLYHSELLNQVLDINLKEDWRRLVGQPSPDSRMRDTEFLLRGLALARRGSEFSGSMSNFVNEFCFDAKKFNRDQTQEAVGILTAFIGKFDSSDSQIFMRGNRFSGVLFESYFSAWANCGKLDMPGNKIADAIRQVKNSDEFTQTLQEGSTKPVNVKKRISLATISLSEVQSSSQE